MAIADRVAVMSQGEIVQSGTPTNSGEILTQHSLRVLSAMQCIWQAK